MASTILPGSIISDTDGAYLDVRDNFERAKADIEAIQTEYAPLESPTFTGEMAFTGNISHRMGELYWHGSSTETPFADIVTFVKVQGTSTLSQSVEFDAGGESGRLRYIGATTRVFHCRASVSFSVASNNQTIEFGIAKNGVVEAASIIKDKISVGSDVDAINLQVSLSLSANDYVELFVRNFFCMAMN
jgi:hypothetical protein